MGGLIRSRIGTLDAVRAPTQESGGLYARRRRLGACPREFLYRGDWCGCTYVYGVDTDGVHSYGCGDECLPGLPS